MDNMEKVTQGFDNALAEEKTEETVAVTEPVKAKRRPFCVWEVAGEEYKLRLTGSVIDKLERTYKANLLTVLTDNGLPPLSVMLTVIQASMQKYHHGIKYTDVLNQYDEYVDAGGDQTTLYTDVILELLGVSGFFTETEEETVQEIKEEIALAQ